MEYVPPQQLDSNIFFGSLATLTEPHTLQQRNIRFFIGIGISNHVFANAYDMLSKPYNDELVMVNFEDEMMMTQDYNTTFNDETNELISKYHRNNTQLLQQLLDGKNNTLGSNIHDLLTPPVTPISSSRSGRYSYLDEDVIPNSTLGTKVHSNTFRKSHLEKFKVFNELISLFKSMESNNNILILSQFGNDYELMTLLISIIMKKDPSVSVMDALQFVKSSRYSDEPIVKEEQIIWSSGLINYHEFVRASGMFWGLGSTMGQKLGSPTRMNKKNRVNEEAMHDGIISPSAKPATADGCLQRKIASCKRVRI